MTKNPLVKYILGLAMCLVAQYQMDGQTISWGPSIPAVQSEDINTCFDSGAMRFEFTNAGSALTDATLEIQLDTGVYYVPSSFSFAASVGISIVEDDISDLSRPIFSVSTIPSGRQISMSIDRIADCEAMAQNIAGSTFIDSIHIYNSGVEVTYANGIANGTVSYEILYGSLSITSVNTAPGLINIGSSTNRSMTITNGAFGAIHEFYVADIFPAGELDLTSFRINPSGINYSIPTSNISTVGDSVIIRFEGAEIAAVDGSSGTNGDGDNYFEGDESFVLSYDVRPTNCNSSNSISSELVGWFGCDYSNRCQIATNSATISINNIAPSIALSDVLNPRLDFCDTVIYSVTLTNTTPETSPAGAAYAKDVTAILGLRSNHSPIATLAAMTQWGSERRNTRHFTNHALNGFPVTLPSVPGLFSTTIPYLPPDYFTSDPDGPGGLTDVDGDGFYDDLPKDSILVISYGTYLTPVDGSCSTGRQDYLHWEHIAADISWFNDCDIEMSPLRQEFNYTNHIRDYQVATNINAPTNLIDDQNFVAGIRPHLFSRIDCNGGSGITGDDMDWITKIALPPGVSMAAGYDMSTYTVVGNEVTTIGKYEHVFTNFPLTFDCATWDGANPVIIPISTRYVCGDGAGVCFEEEMHCIDIELTPQCITDCVGVNPINFTTERISESWTDDTQTALVNLSDPSIETNYVYPFDTIEFYSEGVFNDTLSEQLFLRINYAPENGGNIFNYLEGSIEIIDSDGQYGQTNYNFPLTSPPIVNNLGSDSYELVFDLSSYRTSVDPSYRYGQGVTVGSFDADTVKVSANMVLSNTMTTANPYAVDSLSSEFFVLNGTGGEVVCGSWSSELDYEYSNVNAGNNYDNHSGCDVLSKRFFLTYRANSTDNHPNEYRPPVHIDSAVVIVPEGWTVGDIIWFQNTMLDPADFTLASDGTLTIRRPAVYTDYDKTSTASRSFRVEFIADCRAENGNINFLYTAFYKEFAYLTDPNSHVLRTSSDDLGGVNYTGPSYSIIPVDQSLTAITDTVKWRVSICNTTSDMDVDYNWLALENDGNEIIVDSIVDVTGGGRTRLNTSPLSGGQTFVELDSIYHGVCRDLLIYSRYTSCDIDTLSISNGWSCYSYPPLSDVTTCSGQTEVYVLPQSAQITSNITPLADTPIDPSDPGGGNWGSGLIDMCESFPMELTIVNSQPGNLYDASITMEIPSFGSGLRYVAGSATIEVEGIDLPNVSRPIGPAAEAALVAASSSASFNWIVTLAQLDPSNYGSGEALSGTANSGNNQFIIRWQIESTCDLISGDFLKVNVTGDDPCGSPAEGSTEKIQSYPININGATPPYFSFFTSAISPNNSFEGCNDLKTINVDVLISGGVTSAQDTFEVVLPDGVGYADGFVCNTPGSCPTFVSSSIIGGEEILKFNYPVGVSGTIDFSFDIDTDSRGTCAPSANVTLINKVIIGGLTCGGTGCPSTGVISGIDVLPISITKPILSVTYNSLTYVQGNTTNLFYFDMDIANTGISTDDNIIAEFYCLDPAGNDIIGSAVARDTVISLLPNGGSSNLAGEFTANCDAEDGIGVLIVPEYENCYCDALESMASKSPGLLEIPHDIFSNIPPYVCPIVMTNRHVSFRIVRSID